MSMMAWTLTQKERQQVRELFLQLDTYAYLFIFF